MYVQGSDLTDLKNDIPYFPKTDHCEFKILDSLQVGNRYLYESRPICIGIQIHPV